MKRNIRAGRKQAGGVSFSLLNDDDKAKIHASTLEVLWKTGIFVEDEEALEIFDGGGAVVEPKTKNVKIPGYLVEDSIRSAPETVLMAGRDPEKDVIVGEDRVSFVSFATATKIVDRHTRELREPTKVDCADCCRLLDYLNNIDYSRRVVSSYDKPPSVASLHDAEVMLPVTTKHIFHTPGSGYHARKIIEMLVAVVGSREKLRERPIMTFNNCTITPLKLPRDCSEVIIESARAGMIAQTLSQGMAGGSAPITLAGTLVLHNAEVLSGLVLSQLTHRGNPFFYCSSTCSLDLRLGVATVGNPETAMINAGLAQMARYYLLPSRVAGG